MERAYPQQRGWANLQPIQGALGSKPGTSSFASFGKETGGNLYPPRNRTTARSQHGTFRVYTVDELFIGVDGRKHRATHGALPHRAPSPTADL